MWQYSCQLRGFHVSSEPFAECSKLRAGSSGWFARTNDLVTLTLRQFQQIHRIPWTAALPGRLGYEFSLSFFHAETTSKAEPHAACFIRWRQLCMIGKERSELYYGDRVFPIWRRPHKAAIYIDQRKTFIQHVSDAKGSPGGSACTIGTDRVVLCDSSLYQQRITARH